LLLAQAKFVQNDFAGGFRDFGIGKPTDAQPGIGVAAAYLLYQNRLAAGDTNAALTVTTNLVQIARSEKDNGLQPKVWRCARACWSNWGRSPGPSR